jgi:hypothetical protein
MGLRDENEVLETFQMRFKEGRAMSELEDKMVEEPLHIISDRTISNKGCETGGEKRPSPNKCGPKRSSTSRVQRVRSRS